MDRLLFPYQVAEMLGVHVNTVKKWRKEGKIKAIRLPSGKYRIPESEVNKILGKEIKEPRIIIGYARVSSKNQEKDLRTQVEYLKRYAREKYGVEIEVLADIASGLNEKREGLKHLFKKIEDGRVKRVIITNHERLTRFGYSFLKRYFAAFGTEIEPIDQQKPRELSPQEELVQDLITLVASFAGRLYGFRSHKRKEVVNGTKKLFDLKD